MAPFGRQKSREGSCTGDIPENRVDVRERDRVERSGGFGWSPKKRVSFMQQERKDSRDGNVEVLGKNGDPLLRLSTSRTASCP